MKQAVILLSGGLDSATVLAIAQSEGFKCRALSFTYGQRATLECDAARHVCEVLGVKEQRIIALDNMAFVGSALTDKSISIPEEMTDEIPVTYVAARNTIFLSIALAYAEVTGARDIYIGANAVDYSGYPDCRPEYMAAFEKVANLATKAGVEGDKFKIHAPLINMTKAEIIKEGTRLGLDYSLTISCYQPDPYARACGVCESCQIRKKGFEQAGIPDPTSYVESLSEI